MTIPDTVKNQMFEYFEKCVSEVMFLYMDDMERARLALLYIFMTRHHGLKCELEIGQELRAELDGNACQSVDTTNLEPARSIASAVKYDLNGFSFSDNAEAIICKMLDKCSVVIDEQYAEVVDSIIYIGGRFGRFSGTVATPKELLQLITELVKTLQPKVIYDPCAGLCSFSSIAKEVGAEGFVGQEINRLTSLIGNIRILANGDGTLCLNANSVTDWLANRETLVSELPMGVKIDTSHLTDVNPSEWSSDLIEDLFISRFIHSDIKKAVLITSLNFCNRHNNDTLRIALCDSNSISSVIALPAGILSNTGVRCVVLVLDKTNSSKEIRFVDAADCITKDKAGRNRLNAEAVLDRVNGKDNIQSVTINVGETYKNGCSLFPATYISRHIDVLPGQKLVEFVNLAETVKTSHRFEETEGMVLRPQDMFESITEMRTRKVVLGTAKFDNKGWSKVEGQCIILTSVGKPKFFIKEDDEPLYINSVCKCFKVNEKVCDPLYLIYSYLTSDYYRNAASEGAALVKVNFRHLVLPIYTDMASQRNVVNRVIREEQDRLRQKIKQLELVGDQSQGLVHNLGAIFTKISAGISVLARKGQDDTVQSMRDNVDYALRLINRTGSDFAEYTTSLGRYDIMELIFQYCNAWGNFGTDTFDLQYEFASEAFGSDRETTIKVDKDLFFSMLDCILINANEHGFHKRKKDGNLVIIEVKPVTYKDEKFVLVRVANNGDKFPDGYGLRDYISLGVTGGNASKDGMGGYHVYTIAKKHDGFVSIENDEEFVSVNVLLPIYLTSNNTKFEEYEGECL